MSQNIELVTPKASRWRYSLLIAIAGGTIISVALSRPIAQPRSYHALADRRTVFGVPNFWNVFSNVPFLVAGIIGLRIMRARRWAGDLALLAPAYRSFFVGVILIAFGSGFYHLNPDNNSLVWDRLAMTIALMAFFAIVIGQHIDLDLGRRCLAYLIACGLASVVYWHLSEVQGRGDLRPYLLVQFLPMALIPIMAIFFPPAWSKSSLVWGTLGFYAVAKIVELLDEPIYRAIGISGHTLKHLFAAAGAGFVVVAARDLAINYSARRSLPSSGLAPSE